MQTAIAYIRVSDPRQVTEGNSLTSQRKLAKQHCSSRGYVLDRVFEERGESAKSDHRTVLKEMLAYCRLRREKIHVLIIPKIDRLARYSTDYGNIKIQLGRYGVKVESIGEQFDDSPAGKFTENVLAAAAQFDNEVRAERCKGGMEEAVEEGRWVWKAPIGFRNVRVSKRGTIEPNPTTAPIVIEAFERLACGLHTQKAVWLWVNESGLRVSRPHFYALIRNKAYIGQIEAFGKITNAKPPFVALVSTTIFYKAQTAGAKPVEHKALYDRDNPDFPLRGTAKCECGRFFTACWSKGASQRYPYYRCLGCQRVNRKRELVQDAFREELNRFQPEEGLLEKLLPRIYVSLYKKNEAKLRRTERVKETISEHQSLQSALSVKNAKGVIPDHVAKEQIEILDQKIAELKSEVTSDAPPCPREVLFSALGFIANMGPWWERAPIQAQKKLQSMLYRTGLTYSADGKFRTDGNGLLERIRKAMQGDVLTLVDLSEERTEIEALLKSIHREFVDKFPNL